MMYNGYLEISYVIRYDMREHGSQKTPKSGANLVSKNDTQLKRQF